MDLIYEPLDVGSPSQVEAPIKTDNKHHEYIIQQYQAGRSANALGKEFKKTHHYILNILRDYDTPIRNRSARHRVIYPQIETPLSISQHRYLHHNVHSLMVELLERQVVKFNHELLKYEII